MYRIALQNDILLVHVNKWYRV